MDNRGQATAEYLIVGLILLVMILALGALAGRVQEGLFVQYATDNASHSVEEKFLGAIGDVLLY
jgi:Flp pilus assembly pilin Flp